MLGTFTLLLVLAVAMVVSHNRMLFGLPTGPVSDQDLSEFITSSEDFGLDYYLRKHEKSIGEADYPAYRNHCLRVFAFTKYFLAQQDFKVEPRVMEVVAMAIAHHDVALWVPGVLNYLEPSVEQMMNRMELEMKRSKLNEGEDSGTAMRFLEESYIEDTELAKAIIRAHHKWTEYHHDDYSSTGDDNGRNDSQPANVKHFNAIVNAVRKADWADATMGIIRFGLPQSLLGAAYEKIPEHGFHLMLARFAARLSPDSLLGRMEVLKILKW